MEIQNKNNEPIQTRKQIFNDLEKNGQTYGLSNKSLYRYLNEMNCVELQAGKYEFVDNENQCPFNKILEYRQYNKILCYAIDPPSYGPLVAESINEYYASKNMEDIFHCTAVGDILICFYYWKNGEEKKGKKLLPEIKYVRILENFSKRDVYIFPIYREYSINHLKTHTFCYRWCNMKLQVAV